MLSNFGVEFHVVDLSGNDTIFNCVGTLQLYQHLQELMENSTCSIDLDEVEFEDIRIKVLFEKLNEVMDQGNAVLDEYEQKNVG